MFWLWTLGIAALVTSLLGLGISLGQWRRRREDTVAQRQFRYRREYLEARFIDLARQQDKPRGLRWLDCQWQHDVAFARDRQTGLITAFVSVNVQFEAVEGGDMEDVAAVSTIRDAVALFHYRKGRWGTGGRALFNVNPAEAVLRFEQQYAPLTH